MMILDGKTNIPDDHMGMVMYGIDKGKNLFFFIFETCFPFFSQEEELQKNFQKKLKNM